jgi:hypothetical protein
MFKPIMTMCAFGSCRVEWRKKEDKSSGPRKYCVPHSTIIAEINLKKAQATYRKKLQYQKEWREQNKAKRRIYQRRQYLKNKPPQKICLNFRCEREIRRQGKKISCRKFCTERCYKRAKLWNQRYKRSFDTQLSLTKGMLLAMRKSKDL